MNAFDRTSARRAREALEQNIDAAQTPGMGRVLAWESAWARYIAKLERLDELKAQGRSGYQLRMPKLAVRRAAEALQVFA